MKYIRTKYGIYKKDKVSIVKENEVEVVLLGTCDDYIERTRGKTSDCETSVIIKQADTIEELCDEFVLVRENVSNERMKFYQCLYSRLSDTDFDRKDNDKVFGAIWADKGLVYVVKMNEKGELELL